VRTSTALTALGKRTAVLTNTLSGAAERVLADTVIVVGERVAREWDALVPSAGTVRVIGDALVPRKASHAISEGRAAAEAIVRSTGQAIRTSVLPIVSPASTRASASGARSSPSTTVSR
jgi:hypothetical protein